MSALSWERSCLRSSGKRRVRIAAADHVHDTLNFAERYSVEPVKVAT